MIKNPFVVIVAVATKQVVNPEYSNRSAAKAEVSGEDYSVPKQIAQTSTFEMHIRTEHIAAFNPVIEGPEGADVKSVIYFTSDSGIRPVLSTDTVSDIYGAIILAERR